jgi:hypothetical protein
LRSVAYEGRGPRYICQRYSENLDGPSLQAALRYAWRFALNLRGWSCGEGVRDLEFAKNRPVGECVLSQGFGQGLSDGTIVGYPDVFLLFEILYIDAWHQDNHGSGFLRCFRGRRYLNVDIAGGHTKGA